MKCKTLRIGRIPAVLYGGGSDAVWLFVHGKCGCKEEGLAFAENLPENGGQVLAIDLPEHGERKAERGFDPQHAVPELRETADFIRARWAHASLRANSIGAWFSMLALSGPSEPERALLVSPILDMEALIRGMLLSVSADEALLEREGEIPDGAGGTLSWEYLQYVRAHPILKWDAPTSILYAGRDALTGRETADAFARRFGCKLTVMENGEHWFHTPEQLEALRAWERAAVTAGK